MSLMAEKDMVLLDSQLSPNRTDSITERIARLKRVIAREEPVYAAVMLSLRESTPCLKYSVSMHSPLRK